MKDYESFDILGVTDVDTIGNVLAAIIDIEIALAKKVDELSVAGAELECIRMISSKLFDVALLAAGMPDDNIAYIMATYGPGYDGPDEFCWDWLYDKYHGMNGEAAMDGHEFMSWIKEQIQLPDIWPLAAYSMQEIRTRTEAMKHQETENEE